MSINILEIRNYLLQPNLREHFIDYFEANFITTQQAVNMHVLGQFRLIGAPDHFVWLRGYSDMQSRADSLQSFYDGPVWKKHRTVTNSMMIDSDHVHLLRPLPNTGDLTGGQTADTVAAALASSSISVNTDMIAIDFYQAASGQRQAVIDPFQAQVIPAYEAEGIQLRGCFVAEMGENTFPRHPAIQNPDELVVITGYESEAVGREKHAKMAGRIQQSIGGLLRERVETLFLSPTLRSPMRYGPE